MSMTVPPKPTAYKVTYVRVPYSGEPKEDAQARVVLAETYGQAAAYFESVHGELFKVTGVEPIATIDLDARAAK